ncbi:MAG TPA: OmpA family protein [Burkholderiaceae bacterium]|nr:OmpA family protein [Burkholderiaceae bacterium]
MNWGPVRCLAGAFFSVWLSAACVMAPMAPSAGSGDASAAAQPARQGPTLRMPAGPLSSYLRVQPQQTGLVNAADDGRNTLIAFDRPVPAGSNVWDQDGRPLLHVQTGAVLAVAGVHRGLLIRIGTGNSYLAPNPRAVAAERPAFYDDLDAQDALSRLEGEASQMQAFRRAMSRVDVRRPPAAADPLAAVGTAASAFASASASIPASSDMPSPAGAVPPPVASLSPGAPMSPSHGSPPPHGPTSSLGPASAYGSPASFAVSSTPSSPAADDPTYQRLPGGGALIRVFFASGGRTIVRPDDGLMRLEAEARAADLIRITGHTDSTGGVVTNSALSLARAEAIRSLLMQRGVPAERILVSGIAGARHLADNDSERGRALNRRVEIQLIRRAAR